MTRFKDQPVYCTNCRHFASLLEAIMQEKADNPSPCDQCFPYDVEDSRRYSERPYYVDEQTQSLKSLR